MATNCPIAVFFHSRRHKMESQLSPHTKITVPFFGSQGLVLYTPSLIRPWPQNPTHLYSAHLLWTFFRGEMPTFPWGNCWCLSRMNRIRFKTHEHRKVSCKQKSQDMTGEKKEAGINLNADKSKQNKTRAKQSAEEGDGPNNLPCFAGWKSSQKNSQQERRNRGALVLARV